MHNTTSPSQSQEHPDIFAVETEAFAASRALLLLWRRAVDLRNCRLGESVAAAGRASHLLNDYANPAVIALMIDAHTAAHAGMSVQEWIADIGGPTPELEILSGLDALPLAFSALHADYMQRFDEAFGRRLEDHSDPADAPEAPAAEPNISPDDLLTTAAVCNLFHVKSRTLARWRRNGFPEPLSTETKPHRWAGSQILAYIEEQQVQEARTARRINGYKPGRA